MFHDFQQTPKVHEASVLSSSNGSEFGNHLLVIDDGAFNEMIRDLSSYLVYKLATGVYSNHKTHLYNTTRIWVNYIQQP